MQSKRERKRPNDRQANRPSKDSAHDLPDDGRASSSMQFYLQEAPPWASFEEVATAYYTQADPDDFWQTDTLWDSLPENARELARFHTEGH